MDVRRQWRLTGWLALETKDPTSAAEWLDQLDRPEPFTDSQPATGARESFPQSVAVEPLDQEHLHEAAGPTLEPYPTGNDPRVVDDRELSAEDVRQLEEATVLHRVLRCAIDQEP